MSSSYIDCPHCGKKIKQYKNPAPTVDIIIYEPDRGIVLIKRANPPLGYALPGGFIEVGESAEQAAMREAFEETGLKIYLTGLLGLYSNPKRDPRRHTLSAVYIAKSNNYSTLHSADDAAEASFFSLVNLPELLFDHKQILCDFMAVLEKKRFLAGIACTV